MMNRIPFSFQSEKCMNLIIKTEDGSQLWLGDYGGAVNLELLKKNNIKHVLTAAAMLNITYPKNLDIKHKIIHAFDSPTYKMTQHFEQSIHFIKQGLQNGNVLVHCAAGISRSATCVIAYLMKIKRYPFKEAMKLVKNKRPIANPNYGFQNQLGKYELKLKAKGHFNMQKNNSVIIENNEFIQKKMEILLPKKVNLNEDKMNEDFFNRSKQIQWLKNKQYKSIPPKTKTEQRIKKNSQVKSVTVNKKIEQKSLNNFTTLKLQIPIVSLKKK